MPFASRSFSPPVPLRPAARRITTLVVDDNSAFLEAAARFLRSCKRTSVVGCVESGEEALLVATRLKPQLVVMDVMMPGLSGLDATRRLKSAPDPPLVIVLSLHADEEMRSAAHAAQADGFLGKSEMTSRLPALLETLFERRYGQNQMARSQILPIG